MPDLKQSTATTRMVFMTDSTDHNTGKASLTLTITASKAGAAFASITPTVTDRGSGWYSLALTTAHVDTLGDLALHITATGADPTDKLFNVVAGSLDADVSTRSTYAGGAVASVTAGVTVTTNNDKTGYSLTQTFPTNFSTLAITAGGKINGVVLTDTLTTYTGNTLQTGDAYARIGAAGAGLTALGDTRIANLDAAISSRLATAGYTVPPSAASIATTLLGTTGITVRALDAVADASLTVGDCLIAAACGAAGKENVVGTAYTVKTPSTGTTIRSFTLDSATAPTSRT